MHLARVEMFESGVEQGQMMQVLMQHCQTMKRQETRLRLATAVLLAAFLATLLWLQFHQQTTKDASSVAHSEALKNKGPPVRRSVHLEARNLFGACSEEWPCIKWEIMNDGNGYQNGYQNFKLENQTILHVFKKGFYLINLRISYRIPYGQCESNTGLLTLEVNVSQKHSNYGREREVISGRESMFCREFWLQSITLNRVIMLEDDTSLSVKINKISCAFVSWDRNSHLDVTYL